MPLEQSGKYTFLRSRRQKCVFWDLNKDILPKFKMKNVVKYDVYLDILLVVSIYETITNNTILYIYIYIYVSRTPNPVIQA